MDRTVMAPSRRTNATRLQVPSPQPFYISPSLSSSTSDLNPNSATLLSTRALYALSFDQNATFTFDRPHSSQSLPSAGRFRKNMKDITGFGTTDEEFEALPIAVRRKVCSLFKFTTFHFVCWGDLGRVIPLGRCKQNSSWDLVNTETRTRGGLPMDLDACSWKSPARQAPFLKKR